MNIVTIYYVISLIIEIVQLFANIKNIIVFEDSGAETILRVVMVGEE